jgi:hypothetical protein
METMRGRILAFIALLLSVLPACGERQATSPSEPWPVRVEASGILGYVAVQAEPEDVADACDAILGWTPRGLAPGVPVAVLFLDERVYGGEYGLLLPVDDEAALRASLATCSTLSSREDDHLVFRLPESHRLVQMVRMAGRVSNARSPMDVLSAMGGGGAGLDWSVDLAFTDGRALLVPSFEAGIVAGRMPESVPGLARFSADDLVFSADTGRMQLAFQEPIRNAVAQLRSLLLGAQLAGVGQMLTRMAGDHPGSGELGLPVPGPFLWAVLEMLAPADVHGLQVSLRGVDGGEALRFLGELIRSGGESLELAPPTSDEAPVTLLRLQWSEDSGVGRLLPTLRPAPEVGGVAMLAFDPEAFPPALAAWCRPIAELAMGEGAPAERLIAWLEELLAPLQGVVAVSLADGAEALAATLQQGAQLDVDELGEVAGLLARAAGSDLQTDDLRWLEAPPQGDELVPAGCHWQADDLFVVTLGPCRPGAVETLSRRVQEACSAGLPEHGPAARVAEGEAWLELSTAGSELLVEWAVSTDLMDR